MRRYPGPKPYTFEDRKVFFGREKEIEFLSSLIINNKTTVLQGKSGYGKSSIINAGIIPHLLTRIDCEVIRVRFYNCDKHRSLLPRETLLKTLEIQQNPGNSYLEEILPKDYRSAWRWLKTLQLESIKVNAEEKLNAETQTNSTETVYILLFDQFEELFTYSKEEVQNFGKELFNIILNRIPEEVQEAILKEYSVHHEELLQNKIGVLNDEFIILNKDLPVKLIFSIRSDRFNYLTYLKEYMPNFLNNTYKLKRMGMLQVMEAIKKPAQLINGFQSPSFEIHEDLMQKIMDFLSTTREEKKEIEIFEMQIICSKLEEIAIDYSLKNTEASGFTLTEQIITKYGNIKNTENFLNEIIQSHYTEAIKSIAEEEERLAARYLVENKLIDSISKSRVSLDFVFIHNIGISQKTLLHLIDNKIIRVETNSVSGKSYEISHDSLVKPILQAGVEMGKLEDKLYIFAVTSLNRYSGDDKKVINKIVFGLSEMEQTEEAYADSYNKRYYSALMETKLITEVNFSASDLPKDNKLVLKEAFKTVIQQIAKKTEQRSLNRRIRRYSLALVGFLGVIALLLYVLRSIDMQRQKFKGLVYVGYNIDSIDDKLDALVLSNYILKKKWNDKTDRKRISEKIAELFKAPDAQSRFSLYSAKLLASQFKPEYVDLSFDGNHIVVNDKESLDTSKGTYVIIGLNNKKDSAFKDASMAYFLPNTNILVADYKDPEKFMKYGDSLVFFNYIGDNNFRTIQLGARQELFPLVDPASYPNADYDSRRIRLTRSGNILIPFMEKKEKDKNIGKLGIWLANGNSRVFSTDMSTSISKDGRKIIIGKYINLAVPYLEIRDEYGNWQDSISNAYFADFTPQGSIVYIRKGNLVLRKYGQRTKKDHVYWVNSLINYAFVDSRETVALAQSKDSSYFVDLKTRKIILSMPYKNLIGFDLDRQTIVTIESLPTKNNEGYPAMTLIKKDLYGNDINRYHVAKGIVNIRYNRFKDEVLLQTSDNQLILLTSGFEVKTKLQITPNDLFQFSSKGDVFYYVLNNQVSVFRIDNKLMNLADFNKSYDWLDKNFSSRTIIAQTKNKYGLKL